MTKIRPAGSRHAAIDRTAAALGGYDAAAALLGKSGSYLREAGDQDRDTVELKLWEALDLEESAIRAGQPGYFLALFQGLHERVAGPVPQGNLQAKTVDCAVALGRMAERVREAVEPGSDGGAEISPRERAEIAAEIDLAMETLRAAQRLCAEGQVPAVRRVG